MYQEKIYNIETGETIYRECTREEVLQIEANIAAAEADRVAAEAEAAVKAEAKQALLDRLGITADEAKLLLS